MKLNHINLTSIDVSADRAMIETYFGLRRSIARGKTLEQYPFNWNRLAIPDG